jgi:prolyl oligopeptidase
MGGRLFFLPLSEGREGVLMVRDIAGRERTLLDTGAAAMDPYQRIKRGTAYPAVLLVVGVNDNRVAPWQSGKFGARLLSDGASGKPVWFRLDDDMGHFNTALAAQSREQADVYTFAEGATAN